MQVHLLIRNNKTTIRKSLESLLPLDCEIIVGDIGSDDGTVDVCREYGVKVIRKHLSDNINLSEIRNSLLGDNWNFYLHPWEVLTGGYDSIREIKEGSAYYLPIFKNQIITYEIRLCRNLKFKNPIYETIESSSRDILSESAIYAKSSPYYFENVLDIIKQWDLSIRSIYYRSFALLEQRNYKEFVTLSEHYLSLDSVSTSSIMLRYYLCQIQIHIFNDASKAVRNVLFCILNRPLMAEFWCLLGDIYYKQKRYKKAKSFYKTAIFLGHKRLNNDLWPVEIDKYEKYPHQMIKTIQ
jgi:glycosyltransferase involved in cell wall biosynthesis